MASNNNNNNNNNNVVDLMSSDDDDDVKMAATGSTVAVKRKAEHPIKAKPDDGDDAKRSNTIQDGPRPDKPTSASIPTSSNTMVELPVAQIRIGSKKYGSCPGKPKSASSTGNTEVELPVAQIWIGSKIHKMECRIRWTQGDNNNNDNNNSITLQLICHDSEGADIVIATCWCGPDNNRPVLSISGVYPWLDLDDEGNQRQVRIQFHSVEDYQKTREWLGGPQVSLPRLREQDPACNSLCNTLVELPVAQIGIGSQVFKTACRIRWTPGDNNDNNNNNNSIFLQLVCHNFLGADYMIASFDSTEILNLQWWCCPKEQEEKQEGHGNRTLFFYSDVYRRLYLNGNQQPVCIWFHSVEDFQKTKEWLVDPQASPPRLDRDPARTTTLDDRNVEMAVTAIEIGTAKHTLGCRVRLLFPGNQMELWYQDPDGVDFCSAKFEFSAMRDIGGATSRHTLYFRVKATPDNPLMRYVDSMNKKKKNHGTAFIVIQFQSGQDLRFTNERIVSVGDQKIAAIEQPSPRRVPSAPDPPETGESLEEMDQEEKAAGDNVAIQEDDRKLAATEQPSAGQVLSATVHQEVIEIDDIDNDDDMVDAKFQSEMNKAKAASLRPASVPSSNAAAASATATPRRSHAPTPSPVQDQAPDADAKAATTWWLNKDDNGAISTGILSKLQLLARNAQGGNGRTARFFLVTQCTSLVHIQQSDRWSCGFRNLQMILSALKPTMHCTHPYYDKLLDAYTGAVNDALVRDPSKMLPSLVQLQEQIEQSWAEGFDPRGADHFHQTMKGKKSWIGAVEICFLFRYWSIDSCVVQFVRTKASRELLPLVVYQYFYLQQQFVARQLNTNQPITEWSLDVALDCVKWAEQMRNLQRPEGFVLCPSSDVIPLYLQWEGHSVTIVGIDVIASDWRDWKLLVLDPLKHGRHYQSTCSVNDGNSSIRKERNTALQPFRLSCSAIAQRDSQIVMAGTNVVPDGERATNKNTPCSVTADNASVMDSIYDTS